MTTELIYANVRSQIQNGDAFLFEREGALLDLSGAAISWWTRSKYVHVGMAIWLECRLFVLEAKDAECVRLRLLSDYLTEGRKTHWFELSDKPGDTCSRSLMAYFGMTQLGDNYIAYWRLVWDFLALGRPSPSVRRKAMGVATRMAMRAINKVDPSVAWWCSELYTATAKSAGIKYLENVNPSQMSPADVAAFPFLTEKGLLVP